MMPATENAISAPAVHPAQDSETTLVHAAKAGDMDAFEQLVRRNQGMVFRMAQYITGSPDDAEEVIQEAFLKAFQNLDRFEERSRFSTWVTRIAVNTALMRLRARRGHETVPLGEDNSDDHGALPQEVADWRPDPEQIYTRQELRAILERALAGLPQHYSTVFLLRDVEGFSTAETAEALGISITAVKARLLRARLQLRERLSASFERSRDKSSPGRPKARTMKSGLQAGPSPPSSSSLLLCHRNAKSHSPAHLLGNKS